MSGPAGAPAAAGGGSGGAGSRGVAGRRASGRFAATAARRGRRGARRNVRERRLRRAVRRLEPCLDVVTSFQRRVLVLRSGLGEARPHTRRGAARRLGISLRRVTRAERRGLKAISRADRATGCGYGVIGGGSGEGGFALIAERAPMVAALLGIDTAAGGDTAAAGGDTATAGGNTAATGGDTAARPAEDSVLTDGPGPAADIAAAAAEGAALAAEEGGFPFVVLLALLALVLGLAGVTRGRRVAGAVLDRRAEEARERRHQELVAAIRDILRDRHQR